MENALYGIYTLQSFTARTCPISDTSITHEFTRVRAKFPWSILLHSNLPTIYPPFPLAYTS